METEKVLQAILDRPGQTASQLAVSSGVNERTVKTVLQRNINALNATPLEDQKAGRPALMYRVKDDWEETIRSRIVQSPPPDPVVALVKTVESAEAAMRDTTADATREQIFRLACLQSEAAHAAIETRPDKGEELELRLVRAETRLADAFRGKPEKDDWDITAIYAAMKAAVAHPPRLLWQRYLEQLRQFVEKFDGNLIPLPGSAKALTWEVPGQIAVLIDAISTEPDLVSARVVSAVLESGLPCVNFASKRIWESGREKQFLKALDRLADDPFFCLAPLYVTLDSRNEMGREISEHIERIGNEKPLSKVVTAAREALSRSMQSEQEDLYEQWRFYSAFIENADAGNRLGVPRGVWNVCRGPAFVDVGDDPGLKSRASHYNYMYVSNAGNVDLNSRIVRWAKAPPMSVIGSPMQVAAEAQ